MDDLFTYSSHQFRYSIRGEGDSTWITFHGFGGSLGDFDFIPSNVRLIQIELFGHGLSVDNSPSEHTALDFIRGLEVFLERLSIDQFSIIAFSIGAKPALFITQHLHSRVEQLILLAPDGIYENPWYWIATRTLIGRVGYKRVVERPEPWLRMLDGLKRIKWIKPSLIRFAETGLANEKNRKTAYNTWMSYRHLRIDRNRLTEVIYQNQIKTVQIYGSFDPVIRPQIGLRFARLISQEENLYILECGHQVLRSNEARQIVINTITKDK